MNKVFSTLPTCRARKTTSNVVLPPGETVWNKNRAQINECIDRLVETWFLCHFPEYHNNTIVVFFLTLVWKYSVFTSKPISEGWMSQFGLYVHCFFFSFKGHVFMKHRLQYRLHDSKFQNFDLHLVLFYILGIKFASDVKQLLKATAIKKLQTVTIVSP